MTPLAPALGVDARRPRCSSASTGSRAGASGLIVSGERLGELDGAQACRRAGALLAQRLRVRPAVVLSLALRATPRGARWCGPTWPSASSETSSAADPATRRAAARELRSLGAGARRAAGLAALGDPDDEVRLAAADAAIRLRAAGATDAVAGWLNAPDVRAAAQGVRGGARAAEPAGRRAARAHARRSRRRGARRGGGGARPSGVARGRRAAARSARRSRRPPCASRSSPRSRASAIRAPSSRSSARCEDSSPDVRQAVARALGDLGDARASAALVLALRDQNPDVRRDALDRARPHARGRRGRRHRALRRATRAPALRLAALTALGRIATPDARARPRRSARHRRRRGGLARADARARRARRRRGRGRPAAARAARRLAVAAGGDERRVGARRAARARRGARDRRSPCAAARCPPPRRCTRSRARARAPTCPSCSSSWPTRARSCAARRSARRSRSSTRASPTVARSSRSPPRSATRGPSPEERARMATLLGRTGAPRAAPLLVELTRAQDLGAAHRGHRRARRPGPDVDPLRRRRPTKPTPRCSTRSERPTPRCACTRRPRSPTPAGARARDALAVAASTAGTRSTAPRCSRRSAACSRACRATRRSRSSRRPSTLAAGPERDAIIEALGPRPSGLRGEPRSRASPDRKSATDRRAAATVSPARPATRGLARALLADPDASVRAQAAWALGRARRRLRRAAPRRDGPGRRRRRRDERDGGHRPHRSAREAGGPRVARFARSPPTRAPSCARTPWRGSRSPARAAGTARPSERARDPRGDPAEDVRAAAALAVAARSERRRRARPRALRAHRSLERGRRACRAARPASRCRAHARRAGLRGARRVGCAEAERLVRDAVRGRHAAGGHDRSPRRRLRAAGARGRRHAPQALTARGGGACARAPRPGRYAATRPDCARSPDSPVAPEPLRAILDRAGENRFARTRRGHPAPRSGGTPWAPGSPSGPSRSRSKTGRSLLRVPTSVWANELSLLADEVCARLKERGVAVRELRFRVGAVPPVERPPERRIARAVPSIREVPEELARVLATVGDPELRARHRERGRGEPRLADRDPPAPPAPLTEAQRAARAPRSAGAESAPPARTSPASPGDPPGRREGGRGRSR